MMSTSNVYTIQGEPLINGTITTTNTTLNYCCIHNMWQCYHCSPGYYSYTTPSTPINRLGDFDLHLDSKGNLRVISNGKLLQTFKPNRK